MWITSWLHCYSLKFELFFLLGSLRFDLQEYKKYCLSGWPKYIIHWKHKVVKRYRFDFINLNCKINIIVNMLLHNRRHNGQIVLSKQHYCYSSIVSLFLVYMSVILVLCENFSDAKPNFYDGKTLQIFCIIGIKILIL